MESPSLVLFSIGHSTHPIERFLELLRTHRIAVLADVRSYPGSRRWPQFKASELERSLAAHDIGYRWMPALGGRRRGTRPDSPHLAWTNEAFRAYADHMDTADFELGLAELIRTAAGAATAFMCAEGLWWQCHRRLLADRLLVAGHSVRHIMPDGRLAEHSLPPFATVRGGRLIYSGPVKAGE